MFSKFLPAVSLALPGIVTENRTVKMSDGREKTRGPFDIDLSIPRWLCQKCREPLSIVGAAMFGAGLSTSRVQVLPMCGLARIHRKRLRANPKA